MADRPLNAAQSAVATEHSNVLADFAQAALYTAAVEPMRGLSQAIDHYAGTNIDATVVSAATLVGADHAKNAKLGTSSWYAEQLGSAVGTILVFKAVKSTTDRAFSGLVKGTEEAVATANTLQIAKAEAASSATTGFVYGSVLRPGEDQNVKSDAFYLDRLKGGISDATTFGALGFGNTMLKAKFNFMATSVESSSLAPILRAPTAALLSGPLLTGIVAGLPSGVLGAEVGALKDGRMLPGRAELTNSVASQMFVGAAFSSSHWLSAKSANGDTTNGQTLHDSYKTTTTLISDRVNLALNRGIPVQRYADFLGYKQKDGAPSLTDLASKLPGYRVQIDSSIRLPNIDHSTGKINLPIKRSEPFWRLPLADHADFVHEMAQGPMPSAAEARTLSQQEYVDWRLEREQTARTAEQQALTAARRFNRARGVRTDADGILSQEISQGFTYRDSYIADFNRSQGKTNVPFTEYSSQEERAQTQALKVADAQITLASELDKNADQALLTTHEIAAIETIANSNDAFEPSELLNGRGVFANEMAKIAAEEAREHVSGYENQEWSPEGLQTAVWIRDALARIKAKSTIRNDDDAEVEDTDDGRHAIWLQSDYMQGVRDAGVTDESAAQRWAATYVKLDTENQRRFNDRSSFEDTVFGISASRTKRFSDMPGIDKLAPSAALNLYAAFENSPDKLITTTLQNATKAWEVDPRLPLKLAMLVGEQPLKERIAASVTLDQLMDSDKFQKAREQLLDEDETRLERTRREARRSRSVRRRDEIWQRFATRTSGDVIQSGVLDRDFKDMWAENSIKNRSELVTSLKVPSAIGPAVELIHGQALDETAQRQLANALSGANEPFKTLTSVRAASFKPALDYLTQQEVATGGDADNAWLGHGAASMSLTFRGGWRDWITAQEKRGISHHDATYWLPLQPAEDLTGLNGFLMRNQKQAPQVLESISQRWAEIPEQMKLGNVDAILQHWKVGRYENVTQPKLAEEATKWLVPSSDYATMESWFKQTQEVPVPFSTSQTWNDGNLIGRFLPRSDVRGPFLGKYSNCCQHVLHPIGGSAARYGQESPNAGFFIVEDQARANHVMAISMVWQSPTGAVVFDNVEARGLGDKQPAVRRILSQTANDLLVSHPLVTLGTGNSDLGLTGLPDAEGLTVPTPDGIYTDAAKQVILARRGQ